MKTKKLIFFFTFWILPTLVQASATINGQKNPKVLHSCSQILVDSNNTTDKIPATFIGQDGKLYISKQAKVYAGEPVNTKKFRAPKIIKTVGVAGKSQAQITVQEFLHNGQYYQATISLDPAAIEAVYVQTMPFPIIPGVTAGHVQARFVMKSGHEIQLEDPKNPQSKEFIKDMIVSYEAALPPNTSYNFALGAVDANPLVGRLVSGQQKYDEGSQRQFNQYKLPIHEDEAVLLLAHYLNHANSIQMNLFYNTIVQNCTTTIFDGIDTLPRFAQLLAKNQLQPFLTTIGGDPVIGPAINALLDRFGSEVEQVQDMKDEYKGVFQSLGIPKRIVEKRMPFAPGGDHPLSLVILTRGTENLSTKEKQIIDHLVEDIIEDLPETINLLLASTFSVAEDLYKSPQMIQAMANVISERLNSRLNALNKDLPEKPVSVQIHLTPYPTSAQTADLRSRGLRARLPFGLEKIDLNSRNQVAILSEIQNGVNQVDQNAPRDVPVFLKSLGIHIHLQRSSSHVETQTLLGLLPFMRKMGIQNSQVHLTKLTVPSDPIVSMLLHHKQALQQAANPTVQVHFGSSPKIITSAQNVGQLSIPHVTHNRYLCWAGTTPHTPQLSGTLTEAPLGNKNWMKRLINWFLNGKPISLSITDLEFNLQSLQIETTKIRLGVIGLRCLELESVNRQFGTEANQMLQQLMRKIGPHNFELP